jgi:hypothetical protein
MEKAGVLCFVREEPTGPLTAPSSVPGPYRAIRGRLPGRLAKLAQGVRVICVWRSLRAQVFVFVSPATKRPCTHTLQTGHRPGRLC